MKTFLPRNQRQGIEKKGVCENWTNTYESMKCHNLGIWKGEDVIAEVYRNVPIHNDSWFKVSIFREIAFLLSSGSCIDSHSSPKSPSPHCAFQSDIIEPAQKSNGLFFP